MRVVLILIVILAFLISGLCCEASPRFYQHIIFEWGDVHSVLASLDTVHSFSTELEFFKCVAQLTFAVACAGLLIGRFRRKGRLPCLCLCSLMIPLWWWPYHRVEASLPQRMEIVLTWTFIVWPLCALASLVAVVGVSLCMVRLLMRLFKHQAASGRKPHQPAFPIQVLHDPKED